MGFNLDSNDITAIATSVTAITAAIILLLTLLDRRTKVRIGVFPEQGTNPVIWKIRIHYVNKPIEGCSVLFDNNVLVWDTNKEQHLTIEEGSPRNLTISNNIFKNNALVIVKSGTQVIKKLRFDKIKRESSSG